MKVPRRFELQGRTIRVEESHEETFCDSAYAKWKRDEGLIVVDPDVHRDLKLHSFLHEFTHAAFEACGRYDLSQDEKLVDWMAGLIQQMLKTAR